MSPRSTKCFHQLRHSQHLFPVRLVSFEGGDLGRQLVAAASVPDFAEQSGSNGLGPAETGGFECPQRLVRLVVQSD